MKRVRIIRNIDVKNIYIGPPKGHRHLRLLIDLGGEAIVFQEATIAAIVRGYINIKTHPIKKAVKMKMHILEDRKREYSRYQQLEEEIDDESVIKEITRYIEET